MKKLLYLLILVGAVSLAGFVSASGNAIPEGVETFELGCLTCIIWPDGSGDCYDLSDCDDSCSVPTVTPSVGPTSTPTAAVVDPTSTPGIDPTTTPELTATPNPTTTVEPKPTKQACGQNKDHDCGHGNDGDRSDNNNPHGGPSQGKPGSERDEEQGGTRGGRHDK